VSDKLKISQDDYLRAVAADARKKRLSGTLNEEMTRQAADIEEACNDAIEGNTPSVN
jgi:hypothetical protein